MALNLAFSHSALVLLLFLAAVGVLQFEMIECKVVELFATGMLPGAAGDANYSTAMHHKSCAFPKL
jgi:hypothetical protein